MTILSIILQSLLALIFLMSGLGKISGSNKLVEAFKHLRLPQWFRVVTGIVQFAGTAAIIVGFWEPGWVTLGALILGITGLGGVLAHIRVKDSFKQTFTILILAVIAIVLFSINASDLSEFPGFN